MTIGRGSRLPLAPKSSGSTSAGCGAGVPSAGWTAARGESAMAGTGAEVPVGASAAASGGTPAIRARARTAAVERYLFIWFLLEILITVYRLPASGIGWRAGPGEGPPPACYLRMENDGALAAGLLARRSARL